MIFERSDEIAILGISCCLPGAAGVDQFRRLLREGWNVVRSTVEGRWNTERFLRPGEFAPGFTYTFAGGYIDDPTAFDPAHFGISPREAAQMDPQQRILLEVTWQALEDAAIPPSSLAGRDVGVYVGASMVDHQAWASQDPAVMESHFMTGNSLSIVSNRISYVYDLRGPSFTVDSACSSSFVALAEAMEALRSGRIELAIVAGANLLMSPSPFVGFSQARMLSPTGLSRPFSADADGYVRAEGAVVLVLRRADEAARRGERARAHVVGVGVNSDGRTSGISLPSLDGQRTLLECLYARHGVDPEELAFVEAHGTGTRVGDPIEAAAIGAALGRRRSRPLPIGSVKSNIGHLEAASGLAGLLKSVIALEDGVLPASLFLDRPSEAIDFAGLNLVPNAEARPLDPARDGSLAAVCNYGFGGTNAHAILRRVPPDAPDERAGEGAEALVVSGATRAGLDAAARVLADAIEAGVTPRDAAATGGRARDLLRHRLFLPLGEPGDVAARLRAPDQAARAGGALGVATTGAARTVFVFAGNGCQFPAMGGLAFARNARFRAEVEAIDALFRPIAGWSLAEALAAGVEPERLATTSVAQPLIYAIQSALVAALADYGITPEAVVGHSFGEVAAAEAAGILPREQAVRLVHHRSRVQERVRGLGRMLAIGVGRAEAEELVAAFGAGLAIAACNGPASTTVVGAEAALEEFARRLRTARVPSVLLDIDYPFHSAALDPFEGELEASLGFVSPRAGDRAFHSTVEGRRVEGAMLDAAYWWHNIRNPVRFREAIGSVAAEGATLFCEISPRPILAGPVGDTLRAEGREAEVLGSLAQEGEGDPVLATALRLAAAGASFSQDRFFGRRPTRFAALPAHPFRREIHETVATGEAVLAFGRNLRAERAHPILGWRMADGSPEWRGLIDTARLPLLADHRVDSGVVVPAAALLDAALRAAREIFGEGPLELDDFDVSRALALAGDETREVSTRWAEATGSIEIWSRRRFARGEWVLHARGRIGRPASGPPPLIAPPAGPGLVRDTAEEVYAEASRAGLHYGPMFRLVVDNLRDPDNCDSRLASPVDGRLGGFADLHEVDPTSFDAAFHGLFVQRPQKEGEVKAHMPVRFRGIRVWKSGAAIVRSVTTLIAETERFKTIAINLFDTHGDLAVSVDAAVLRAVHLQRAEVRERTFRMDVLRSTSLPAPVPPPAGEAEPGAARVVLRAFAVSLAHRLLVGAYGADPVDPARPFGTAATPAVGAIVAAARAVADGLGLIVEDRVAATSPLPPPEEILATLVARFPEANAEIRLAAAALAELEGVARSGEILPVRAALRDQLESEAEDRAVCGAAVADLLRERAASVGRRLRVLVPEPWRETILRPLEAAVAEGLVEATLLAETSKAVDDARTSGRHEGWAEHLVAEAEQSSGVAPFDLLIGLTVAGGERVGEASRRTIAAVMREGATMAVVEPAGEAMLDLLCGIHAGWFVEPASGGRGLDRPAAPGTAASLLASLGGRDVVSARLHGGLADLVIATAPAPSGVIPSTDGGVAASTSSGDVVLVARPGGVWHERLLGAAMRTVSPDAPAEPVADGHVVFAIDPSADDGSGPVAEAVLALTRWIEALAEARSAARLHVVVDVARGETSPIAEAMRGFGRVAVNEFPAVDLRLVGLDATMAPTTAVERLRAVLAAPAAEIETDADAASTSARRVRRGAVVAAPLDEETRAVLRFEQAGRLDRFAWVAEPRRTPGEGEVEIEVAAVGLNYRDVLVGLGILDDDLLGAGLTGAALGFECSGIVTRVGPGASRFAVGERVMGFAASTFASHLVAPDWHFFAVPDGLSLEAAATVPVAFATARHALVDRAGLRAGESVLIHGGAGGVGLAAIQIARALGARPIATASSGERRAIAQAAGAVAAFPSRDERFVEPIARECGGVDVVLNSLAGPAMRESLRLVRPFGRFVELGKRDYLANTALELRPFVRNIGYFGVDLDELLAHDRAAVERVMREIAEGLARGDYAPLPHRVFEGEEAGSAFRLMQASEHVGKIVVRPPRRALPDLAAGRWRARADGVHLVVGGTGGFGFETARWLVGRGARKVVLASRRGRVEEGRDDGVAAMRAAGAVVLVEALDVTDRAAVAALAARLSAEHGPVRGVVHAAVHLDDGLIAGLEPDRLKASLAAKIDGAVALEHAFADTALDYFVVCSSATTLIGSPGQGAYVAANAWLEGFARRRRARGLPALAVGWGAISDAGIIARDQGLAERLRRTTGVTPVSSGECLAHLGRLLAAGDAIDPVQYFTNIAASSAAEKLRLVTSPTFAGLALAREQDGAGDGEDLATAIAGRSRTEATEIVTEVLVREAAQILRTAPDAIDRSRPLAELGLDSLMALELQLAIERVCRAEFSLVGAGDRRLADVAAMIVTALEGEAGRGDDATPDRARATLINLHGLEGLEGETGPGEAAL